MSSFCCGEYGIIPSMERFFNIAGPCNPARHYTVPPMARLPEGWLVVLDPDIGGDWDAKISLEDIRHGDRVINLFRC